MSTKSLLVVDDSATTRMLISLTLKKEGVYRIVEVANGREAVEKLSIEPVDCVLTDINMPQMNGLDLDFLHPVAASRAEAPHHRHHHPGGRGVS